MQPSTYTPITSCPIRSNDIIPYYRDSSTRQCWFGLCSGTESHPWNKTDGYDENILKQLEPLSNLLYDGWTTFGFDFWGYNLKANKQFSNKYINKFGTLRYLACSIQGATIISVAAACKTCKLLRKERFKGHIFIFRHVNSIESFRTPELVAHEKTTDSWLKRENGIKHNVVCLWKLSECMNIHFLYT